MARSFILCVSFLMAITQFCLAQKDLPLGEQARKARLSELSKLADKYDNSTCWGGWLKSKYSPDSALSPDEVSQKYTQCLKEMCELDPKNISLKIRYIDSIMFLKKYEEAEKLYLELREEILSKKKPELYSLAAVEYHIAETRIARGDRNGAIEMLKTLLGRKINTIRRGKENFTQEASVAYAFLTSSTLNALKLPRYTNSKPFPEPKDAHYTDKFTPLGDVTVALKGVSKDDARVKLLSEKLKARGIGVKIGGKAPYTITLELTSNAPVDKKEGYTLTISEKGAIVKARDAQGILWGVVSFVQCLSHVEKSVRICEINDWPSSSRRGYLGGAIWSGCTEFTLFSKMNSVVMQKYPISVGRDTPLNIYQCAQLAKEFNQFGLELYFGISNYTMGTPWPYTWPGTLAKHIDRCSLFAEMGANVYYPNDDGRYPIHPDDAAQGLNASDTDAPHLVKLYNAIKAKYPKFKLIYCPPFYWGPDSSAAYPDDREKYLKSLRILPAEIDLYWTGGQVKGYDKSPRQVKWFTELTGHKPTIFQNGTGPHNLLSYLADETDWNAWHYPGFFENDIACFHKNSHTPSECVQITTLADCLWNTAAYNKRRSVERGINMLLGEKMYSILAPGVPALAYFDKYKYGELNADILHEDINDLTKKYLIASNCWAEAVKYNPTVQMYGAFGRGVGFAANVIKKAKNPPNFLAKYSKYIPKARELAEKEMQYNKDKGDLLYLPTDMTGRQMDFYDHPTVKDFRFAKFIRGKQTQFSGTEFRFECDPFPPAGDYELTVSGMDDEVVGENPIVITVNDKVVYKGISGFRPAIYTLKKLRIPFDVMERYNKVRISNDASGANANGPPYIAISAAMLRKTGEK